MPGAFPRIKSSGMGVFSLPRQRRRLHCTQEMGGIEWLHQQSLTETVDLAQRIGALVHVAGDENGWHRSAGFPQLEVDLEPAQQRHAQIQDQAGDAWRQRLLQGLPAVAGNLDHIAVLLQNRLKGACKVGVVVCHQDHAAWLHEVERVQQFCNRERLVEHSKRAVAHRLRYQLLETESGHHEDARAGSDPPELGEGLHAVHAGQLHVHQDNMEIALTEECDARLAACGQRHGISAHLQNIGDTLRVILVVVDDENATGHAAISSLRANGRRTTARVPTPGSLESSISPPCCSTICFTVGRPRPVPKLLVLKSGSKIRGSTSGAIPVPVSLTAIWMSSPCCRVATDIWRSPLARSPSGTDCAALSRRFTITRRSRSGSKLATTPDAARSRVSLTRLGSFCSSRSSPSHRSRTCGEHCSWRLRA